MSEIVYVSLKYEGNSDKLCEVLKEKLDNVEIKKKSNSLLYLGLDKDNLEDITFLKSLLNSENIKIEEVIILFK